MILFLLFQFCTESIVFMISELAEKDKAQSTDLASGGISDFLRERHL